MGNSVLKSADWYLRAPIIFDFSIALVLGVIFFFWGSNLGVRIHQENNILYLISVDASLSGFVIAALTVLVTVKANAQYKKNVEDFRTGVDFLFNSALYPTLIRVFLWCIAEFVFVVFALFVVNFFYNGDESKIVNSLFLGSLVMSLFAAIRTVGVLASVVLLQAKEK